MATLHVINCWGAHLDAGMQGNKQKLRVLGLIIDQRTKSRETRE